MNNKEIYIDNIDVSGCSWYTQGGTGMICADWHLSNDCSKNPNCYYKQLKAKEQECERLTSTLAEIKEIANSDNHYFSDGTILRYEVVNKILQKISEVEDE